MSKLIDLGEAGCVKSRLNYTPFSINKPDQLPNVQFNFRLKVQSVWDSNYELGLAQYLENPVEKAYFSVLPDTNVESCPSVKLCTHL
jgi:hypothetical protein